MIKYVSRKYLKEKWEPLKIDMENVIDVYGKKHSEDKVDSSDLERCYYNVLDKIEAIKHEIQEGN